VQVFKFGGASVKDANGVKNVVKVLEKVGHENTLIVVSAMGKTTNALEVVIDKYLNEKNTFIAELDTVKNYHRTIMMDLFNNQQHQVFVTVEDLFN
jgi:aspartate kinase